MPQDYSNQILVNAKPEIVFKTLTKDIDKWWTELSNKIDKVGDQLVVQFEDTTSWVMNVVEYNLNRSTKWFVIHAHHDLKNLSKKDEWKKTTLNWKIEENEIGSIVYLTHEGLNLSLECYDICRNGWDFFLKSLKNYLESGEGKPFNKT